MDYSVTKFLKVNLKFSKNEKKYLNLEIYKEQRNSTVCGLFLTRNVCHTGTGDTCGPRISKLAPPCLAANTFVQLL